MGPIIVIVVIEIVPTFPPVMACLHSFITLFIGISWSLLSWAKRRERSLLVKLPLLRHASNCSINSPKIISYQIKLEGKCTIFYSMEWALNLSILNTKRNCPNYRGVLISEVSLHCNGTIAITVPLYREVSLFQSVHISRFDCIYLRSLLVEV